MTRSYVGWIAGKLAELDVVRACSPYDEFVLRVEREDRPDAHVACLRVDVLTGDLVTDIASGHPDVEFILNLPAASRTLGDAYVAAQQSGVAIGGLGDAMRALFLDDPSQYVHPETGFRERIFAQHSMISRFERLDDSRYRLHRRNLPPVVILVRDDYEVTADGIRTAVAKYESFDAYVTSNPNAVTISCAAVEAADQCEVLVMRWPEFMSAVRQRWT